MSLNPSQIEVGVHITSVLAVLDPNTSILAAITSFYVIGIDLRHSAIGQIHGILIIGSHIASQCGTESYQLLIQ